MPNRRAFLRGAAISVFGAGALPAWLGRAAAANRSGKVLVVVFQRGAADGLNMVVPFGDSRYFQLRPSLAIPAPSRANADSAVDLDGFFGLHPSLGPLAPLYRDRHLAIVEAAGSPDPTRSHFDAQDFMESGTPGRKATEDGWLNRVLRPEVGASPVRAVSLTGILPRSLRGAQPAVAISDMKDFRVRENQASDEFRTMYAASADTLLHGAAQETFEAVKLVESLASQPYTPGGGASYPRGRLGADLRQIAQLIKADVGLEVAFADIGGWDHHTNETPQLANRLREFSSALAAFACDLGDRLANVVLVTMSEFGRTARENGGRGTDHGHANVMFVLGGPVRGGRIAGKWPGLAAEQLYEGRDLALTTDFRVVLSELVAKHLGHPDPGQVFPGFRTRDLHVLNLLA
jgi:uncharacterized protein (DUF1501 family)